MPSKSVLILGWFGAKPKQLLRFDKLYRDLGFSPTVLPTSIADSISFRKWQKWRTNGPDEELEGKRFDRVHVFSGSVFRYHNWLLYDKNCLGHEEIVFDSSPFFPTPQQVSKYAKHTIIPGLNTTLPEIALDSAINMYWKNQDYEWQERLPEYINNLESCPRSKLLITSRRDKMLDHDAIAQLVNKWNNNSCTVAQPSGFVDSTHLDHYKLYPELYKNALFEFNNR